MPPPSITPLEFQLELAPFLAFCAVPSPMRHGFCLYLLGLLESETVVYTTAGLCTRRQAFF